MSTQYPTHSLATYGGFSILADGEMKHYAFEAGGALTFVSHMHKPHCVLHVAAGDMRHQPSPSAASIS
jgi:hypothetical protein